VSDEKHTLPLRLTTALKAAIEKRAQANNISMTAWLLQAAHYYATAKERQPFPPLPRDGRKRAKPPAPLPALPKLPLRHPAEHEREWMAILDRIAAHPAQLNEETWRRLLALYCAWKGSGTRAQWRLMARNRSLIEQAQPLPPEMSKFAPMLVALWRYEQLRKKWAKRTPRNRDKMPPAKLEKLRARERKSQARTRTKRKLEAEQMLQELQGDLCAELPQNDLPTAAE